MAAIDQIPAWLLGNNQLTIISYATPHETLQAPPLTLGTVEPSPGQIRYTITIDDLPVFDPAPLTTPSYHAIVYAAGINTGADRSVTGIGYKNGVGATNAAASVPDGDSWTLMLFFPNAVVGDVLDIALSSYSAGAAWDYQALAVNADSYQVAPDDRLLARAMIGLAAFPTLLLGTPTLLDSGPFHVLHENSFEARLSSSTTLDALIMAPPYYVGRIQYASVDTTSVGFAGATRPLYKRNMTPFSIWYWLTEISI